jgi:hypothetical protein
VGARVIHASQVVSKCGLAIYIKKIKYLNAKEELWETQIFHHAKNYNFLKKKILLKEK